MSEPRIGPMPVEEEHAGYSKDYWDVVFEQLARRRLFQLGVVVLALLYGSAIYAPLLASDRPYVLEAIRYEEYDRALKALYPVTLGLGSRARQTREQYLEKRSEGSDQTYEEALGGEARALADRVATLRTYLPEEHHGGLAVFLAAVERGAARAREGRHEAAGELAQELKETAKELRDRLAPRRPAGADGAAPNSAPAAAADAPADGQAPAAAAGVELRGVVSYPLLESTNAWEVCFMVLWAFVLLWPLWNRAVNRLLLRGDRARIRAWRRRKLVVALGCSAAAGLAWSSTVHGRMSLDDAPYKRQLGSGEIVARRVLFPPVAFGFAETHLSEQFRPPTWITASEISEEGYYVRGPRVPVADPTTGFVPAGNPVERRFGEPERNSPWRHPLGTDSLGRDLLVRILWGGRVSLAVGLVSTVILMVIGVVVGCLAGYFGGRVDLVISRVIEVVICFPVFFLILVVVAFVGPSILNIMVVIGLVRWTGVARLARGELLRLRELDFVVAARALGLPTVRTVFRHMLPNAVGPLLVAGTFSVAAGILVESGLSFLGFGISLPIPSWGSLVTESRSQDNWWIQIFPGLLIFLTVLCYNLVGDGIRDAMDPKLKA